MNMGRRKTVHTDLPPRMVCRTLKSGKRLFYYGVARIPLGGDLNTAREQWAKLENAGIPDVLKFPAIAQGYQRAVVPLLRKSTQREYNRAIANLSEAFRTFSPEQIHGSDVKEYMFARSKKIAGIRERAVLSSIFKWAIGTGKTNAPNPCQGVSFSKQERRALGIVGKRERYVTDTEYYEVWNKAPPFVQDVMDLCLLTAQRLGDVLRWTRQNIKEGVLQVSQSKTGAEEGIRIEGELKAVLERVQSRPRTIPTMYLLADDKGQRLSQGQVYYAFVEAKGAADWTIRDLRRKAAKDSPDLETARGLLGHYSEQTTAQIYRTKDSIVGPLK